MAPGYPLNDEIIAPIVPVDEEITDGWGFELWHKKGLGEYMCINAFTAEGMEKVAEINGITLPEDFFGGKTNADLHNSFIRLSSCLHHLGNYKGIHINFIEGMHRQMAWTHAFYGASFNQDGFIEPNTLSIKDFTDADFKVENECFTDGQDEYDDHNHGLVNDEAFREKLRKRFFEAENDQFLQVPLSVYYVNKKQIDGKFLSEACVQMSKLHSESKRESNIRCPWQTLGVEAEKFVNSFEAKNIVYRPDFSHDRFLYPKHIYANEAEVEDQVQSIRISDANEGKEDIVEALYGTNEILNTKEFKAYANNPYSKEAKSDLMRLLEVDVLVGKYNVTNREEVNALEGRKMKIGYPFYPSYVSMAEDVGGEYGENARMNTMMANNLIHFPLVVTILWEAIKGISRNATLQDQSRKRTIDYYLRFHNDPDENQTNLNLHGAYGQLYDMSQAKNMYSSGAEILGAAHTICQMWNVFIAVETEACLNEIDNERLLATFRNAGGILKRTFTNIGDTVIAANHMDVAIILGEFILCITCCA